jgi:hypothetical protein
VSASIQARPSEARGIKRRVYETTGQNQTQTDSKNPNPATDASPQLALWWAIFRGMRALTSS